MTNKKYKSISISNLIINPDNDRFESVENEKQAIDIMLTKLGDKIYYIAIHCCPEKFYHKVSCLFESSSETLTGSSGLL